MANPKTIAEQLAELANQLNALALDVAVLRDRLTKMQNDHTQKFSDLSRLLNFNKEGLGEVEAKTEMVVARTTALARKVRKTK